MTQNSRRNARGQFAPVPDADTSVVNVSGNPQSEHGPGTVFPEHDPKHGPAMHPIPQRRARMIGNTDAHDFDHEARGLDAHFNAGHLRSQAHVLAAQGDPLITSLMGDQRSPAARAQGRAAYLAALDRAGHDSEHNE